MPNSALALRDQEVREKKSEILSGLEETLRGDPTRLVQLASAAIGFSPTSSTPSISSPVVQTPTFSIAAGMEEKGIVQILLERMPARSEGETLSQWSKKVLQPQGPGLVSPAEEIAQFLFNQIEKGPYTQVQKQEIWSKLSSQLAPYLRDHFAMFWIREVLQHLRTATQEGTVARGAVSNALLMMGDLPEVLREAKLLTERPAGPSLESAGLEEKRYRVGKEIFPFRSDPFRAKFLAEDAQVFAVQPVFKGGSEAHVRLERHHYLVKRVGDNLVSVWGPREGDISETHAIRVREEEWPGPIEEGRMVSLGVRVSVAENEYLRFSWSLSPKPLFRVFPLEATGLEGGIEQEVREVLDGLVSSEAERQASAAETIRQKMILPMAGGFLRMSPALQRPAASHIAGRIEHFRELVSIQRDVIDRLQKVEQWGRQLFAEARVRGIRLTAHPQAGPVIARWANGLVWYVQMGAIAGQALSVYRDQMQRVDLASDDPGLRQVVEERRQVISGLIAETDRLGDELDQLSANFHELISMLDFGEGDTTGETPSAAGLEERLVSLPPIQVPAAVQESIPMRFVVDTYRERDPEVLRFAQWAVLLVRAGMPVRFAGVATAWDLEEAKQELPMEARQMLEDHTQIYNPSDPASYEAALAAAKASVFGSADSPLAPESVLTRLDPTWVGWFLDELQRLGIQELFSPELLDQIEAHLTAA